MERNIYWGDMHAQFQPERPRREDFEAYVEGGCLEAKEHLDFCAIVYYPACVYKTSEGLLVESVGMHEEFLSDFEFVRGLVEKYNHPGEFVALLGYEWTGNRTRWGDCNVFYRDNDGPLDLEMEFPQLLENLRKRNAIAIPHHTGYEVGQRGKDWELHDEELCPVAEIYSVHGSSEGCNTPLTMNRNRGMSPRVSGGTVQDGLARGYHLGIIASGDNGTGFPGKWGWGLVAALADELTPEGIWEAFKCRRVYGVTGDRIRLNFRAGDVFMGEVMKADGPVAFHIDITGTQALDRIEIIRNNRVAYTYCHNGTWEVPRDGRVRAKLPIEFGWGPGASYGFVSDHQAAVAGHQADVGQAAQVQQIVPRKWEGRLGVSGGALLSAEGCFTCAGNRILQSGDGECDFKLVSQPRGFTAEAERQQTIVFEIEGDTSTQVTLEADGHEHAFSLAELMRTSRVFANTEEVEQTIKELYGLSPDDLEKPDVFWQEAYKVKQHQAIPEAGYRAKIEWVDENPPQGHNWYYLRISQLNGQMAWSSPIWVDN